MRGTVQSNLHYVGIRLFSLSVWCRKVVFQCSKHNLEPKTAFHDGGMVVVVVRRVTDALAGSVIVA